MKESLLTRCEGDAGHGRSLRNRDRRVALLRLDAAKDEPRIRSARPGCGTLGGGKSARRAAYAAQSGRDVGDSCFDIHAPACQGINGR